MQFAYYTCNEHLLLCISEGFDYVDASSTITFLPGDFSGVRRCTNITINDDDILEYNEAFNVIPKENSSRLDVQANRNSTRIIIMEDDDCKYCIKINVLQYFR